MTGRGSSSVLAILTGLLLLSGCAPRHALTRAEAGGEPGAILASEEARIGDQIRGEILSKFRVYTEPQAVEYVSGIGKKLSDQAERKELPYQFTILYNDEIYATSAPGGGVYLTTGMILFLENEAELAAVMAHEIGELQDKDPKLSRSRAVMNTVLTGSTAVAPAFGQIGILAALGLAMAKTAMDASVPTLEKRMYKADERAFRYMVRAGFDPQGLIDLQYKFLNAKPEDRAFFYHYYQSRPVNEERMSRIAREFERLPLQDRAFSAGRERFLEQTKGIREIPAG